MPKLIVVYDPTGRLSSHISSDAPPELCPKVAQLDVADGIEGKDIYDLARKLAEMLLEQVA